MPGKPTATSGYGIRGQQVGEHVNYENGVLQPLNQTTLHYGDGTNVRLPQDVYSAANAAKLARAAGAKGYTYRNLIPGGPDISEEIFSDPRDVWTGGDY